MPAATMTAKTGDFFAGSERTGVVTVEAATTFAFVFAIVLSGRSIMVTSAGWMSVASGTALRSA